MINTFTLDPKLTQHAKQIYTHLGLIEKRKDLLKNDLRDLPLEIQKMHLLFSTDATELTKVVRQFIQVSQQSKQKGTLEEFIQVINKSLDDLCKVEDWDDELDDFGLDEDTILEAADCISNLDTNKSSTSNCFVVSSNDSTTTTITTNSTSSNKSTNNKVNSKLSNKDKDKNTEGKSGTRKNKRPLDDTTTFGSHDGKKRKQLETNAFPGFNVIVNPTRWITTLNKAPWILLYELARIASICQIDWNDLDTETIEEFIQLVKIKPELVHDRILKWQAKLGGSSTGGVGESDTPFDNSERLLNLVSIERCSDMVWKFGSAVNNQQDNDVIYHHNNIKMNGKIQQTRSIHYTAKIHLSHDEDETPTIQLNVPQFQASNRFFRKFGGERFLELQLAKQRSSCSLSDHKSYILRPFLLMGITYRFLFMKDDRLILFATEGPGLTPLSIKSVIEWHIPIIENWGLTTCKFASRMGLGYSNSIPTLTFEPKNVRFIDDIFAKGQIKKDNTCMTDGCGIISAAAMRKIMGTAQNDNLPCAVQGRIGGAKGVWIVSPELDMETGDWIEIRASQNKFNTGLPGADMKTDPLHFTFDLVKTAFCIYPSHLNTQFIQCLSAGGVPTSVFVDLLKDCIGNIKEIISDNKNNRLLRDWLVKTGGLMTLRRNDTDTGIGLWQRQKIESNGTLGYSDTKKSDNPEENDHDLDGTTLPGYTGGKQDPSRPHAARAPKFNRHSGKPSNLFESLVRLLDAGFNLSNPYLAKQMSSVFRLMMESLSTKYRVEVKQSCSLMCIPDPTGTLKPNEVFLQLSKRRVDEKTGIHAGLIVGDILVARSPCGMKSDVQKVQAVDNSSLRLYSDVVVFPTQGSRSLASKLSGGDYDGDLIFCCWDKRLVDTFTSSDVPKKIDKVDLAFEKDTRTVRDELRNCRNMDDQESILQRMFLSAPSYDGTLGVYENWRTVVSEITSLDDPQVIYLAQMCALLVDAPKQGLWVKPWIKKEDRERFSVHPVPQWFADKWHSVPDPDEKGPSTMSLLERPLTTAMDHLHETIQTEIEHLTQYAQSLIPIDKTTRMDPDLTTPWEKTWKVATDLDDTLMLDDLKTLQDLVNISLESYIQGVRDVMGYVDWAEKRRKARQKQKQQGDKSDDDDDEDNYVSPAIAARLPIDIDRFSTFHEVEEFHAQHFFGLGLDCMKSRYFKTDLAVNNGRMIHTLKASYAYIRTIEQERYSKYCYVVAHDNLARMKSDAIAKKTKANGLSVSLVPSIYPAMTMDRIWIRKEKEISQLDV
ncbi:RNA dependent RNA polymerase-domain-containing protein [Chlamydoabsidia padenii]|nr:RNA dependent RNA polymerase-domain-containing protein [Chlamydoabsidia padenii]